MTAWPAIAPVTLSYEIDVLNSFFITKGTDNNTTLHSYTKASFDFLRST